MNLNNVFNALIITFFLIKEIKSFVCNEATCPSEQGQCIENICLCAPGYTTFYSENEEIKTQLCNYPYKYKYYAIWFEMIFPFGLGHFYACRYLHGLTKFILFWFLAFTKSIFKKKIRGYPELAKISILFTGIFGILYCADFFCYNFDFYLDGNKIPLI